MDVYGDGNLTVMRFGPLGSFANNAYIIADEASGEALIVDMPSGSQEVIEAAKDLRVKGIILTHTHHDHVGSLAELQRRTRAKIIVHETEADYLRQGRTPLPKGTTCYSKALVSIGKLLRIGAYAAVAPDILLTSTLDLSEIGIKGRVLPTPGHTQGSMSIVLESGLAIVGDAMFNIRPDSVFPPFANDVPQLLQSWRLLINTGCRTFYPAHGRPIEREKLIRCFVKRIKRAKI